MNTSNPTGENRIVPQRDARHTSRRRCLSWLAILLLALGGTARAAIVEVDVGNSGFGPDDVTIQPGDTVLWTWSGGLSHTVASGSNGVADGIFSSGGSQPAPFTFSRTFPVPGTFNYFCGPHFAMGMIGVVRVATVDTPGTLGNISTRLRVEAGDNALIGGFIVTGTQPKRVIVRAIGPSLLFAGGLVDPIIEVHGPEGFATITNDNWRSTQEAEIIATTVAPTNDFESAIVATLPANGTAYTAIMRGVNNGTGVGLVEVYDLDRSVDSKLANISTRGLVQAGDDVLIAGTIVLGTASQRVLVRAIGPSLPIQGKLADPALELRDANGAVIRSNNNWRSDQEAEITATTIPPGNDLEAALIAILPASGASYTAIVSGVGGTTGVAVVEVYALN